MKRILIVDDEEDLRDALAEGLLDTEEFEVIQAASIQEAKSLIEEKSPDAAIIDVGLGDGDGRDLCTWIRDKAYDFPVLMLTGQTRTEDEVRGLEAGADDYILKPTRMPVVLARLRNHLSRHEQSDDASTSLGGGMTLKSSKKMIEQDDGFKIRLTDKEVGILKMLLRSVSMSASKEDLLKEVWEYSPDANTHTLETHIYRLRQKIELDPKRPRILQTRPGGYKLGYLSSV